MNENEEEVLRAFARQLREIRESLDKLTVVLQTLLGREEGPGGELIELPKRDGEDPA